MTLTQTPATATAQEIFDKTARHIFAQGKRAMTGGTCSYRTGDGLACAVGCHISDAFARAADTSPLGSSVTSVARWIKAAQEGESAYALPAQSEVANDAQLILQHFDLLRCLQNVHDGGENWVSTEDMRHELRDVGMRFDLDTSVLDTLSFAA